MKLKRIIAALFATALLLAPVSAAEARSWVCPACGNLANMKTRCGGIVSEANLEDIGYNYVPIKIGDCGEHPKGTCQVTIEYGMTVKYCPACPYMTEITGIHECHESHSSGGATRDICPY